MLDVEEPCSSNNSGDTEIVFESNMAEPLIKDKGTMTYDYQETVPMRFCQLTRESDVLFFTGLEKTRIFQTASVMTYWDGSKKALKPRKGSDSIELIEALLSSPDIEFNKITLLKPGPKRKLTLEQEFLLVLMKLRLGIMVEVLALRFKVSPGKVSQIFITSIKLISKELRVLVIWPSSSQIKSTFPNYLKKLYHNMRVIIDCTEVFMETPSSLVGQTCLYSDYKHHCKVKFLVAITPNGALSWISPTYGGQTSDVFIVWDCGFLDLLEPADQVMTDQGFKIKTDLAMKQCAVCIPPSAVKGNQMTFSDVKKTSNIANVRIYVEQAIKRMKEFHILKTQQLILYLPIFNDIVRVIASLVNLKKSLAK